MKKSLLAILMLMTLAVSFTGCKKDEDEDDGKGNTSENTWVIDGKTYNLTNNLVKPVYENTSNLLVASGKSASSSSVASVAFESKPASSGNYTVISGLDEFSGKSAKISIIVDSKIYISTGKTGNVAKVTVSGGKLKVEFSNIELVPVDDMESPVTASGNLVEG